MVDLELLLVANLRERGILLHAKPRLTVGYSAAMDSGIPLTWPIVKAILGGLDDPDATVKDWLFTCDTGDVVEGKRQHTFRVLCGAYNARDRAVKGLRFETAADTPWPEPLRATLEQGWQAGLNRLIDYLRS